MMSTMCIFVRDERTRRIAHHEINEVSAEELMARDYAKAEDDHIEELLSEYPRPDFDIFVQGFSSLQALYNAWPELEPDAELLR